MDGEQAKLCVPWKIYNSQGGVALVEFSEKLLIICQWPYGWGWGHALIDPIEM